MRTEEHVFFERHENRRTCLIPANNPHVLLFSCLTPRKQSPCSHVLLSYPSQAIPMFSCSPVLPLANNPHVLLFSCLTPRKQSPCSSVLLSYPRKQSPCSHVLLSYPSQAIPMFSCSSVFPKKHVLLSNYHAHFSYSN